MIYVNPSNVVIPPARIEKAERLTEELRRKQPDERAAFIASRREATWGHIDVVNALRRVVGNKCWYSEVALDGFDPEVDHFRPKGRVVEIEYESFEKTGEVSSGYWWLAFESRNFRLTCTHANQRRVDEETEGGKADFFPVVGDRAAENLEWGLIAETVLPLDPCSASDMRNMWFDPDGHPTYIKPGARATDFDVSRMRVTIWLYHLDKPEIARSRLREVHKVRLMLKSADIAYKLWAPGSAIPNMQQKGVFDERVSEIMAEIADTAIFAGAKRVAVRLAVSSYPWIDEFVI